MNLFRFLGIVAAGLSLAGCQSLLSPFRSPSHAGLDPTLEREIAADYFRERTEQGRRLLSGGNYALAIEAFRQAAADPTQRPKALNGLAVGYAALGRTDLARRYFQEAMLADPTDTRFAANLLRLNAQVPQDALTPRLADADVASTVSSPDAGTTERAEFRANPKREIIETRIVTDTAISRPVRRLANSAVSIELPAPRQVRAGKGEIFITSARGSEGTSARRERMLPLRIVMSEVPRR